MSHSLDNTAKVFAKALETKDYATVDSLKVLVPTVQFNSRSHVRFKMRTHGVDWQYYDMYGEPVMVEHVPEYVIKAGVTGASF